MSPAPFSFKRQKLSLQVLGALFYYNLIAVGTDSES